MPTDFITNDVATAKKSQVGEFIFPVFSTNGDSGFNYANPYWYMQDGFESIGSTDDEMTFLLKAENVANYDFDMVMNLNGVLNDIKFDTPMVALRRWVDNKSKYRYDVCFAGYVKNIRQVSHALEQYIEVTCTSVKKAMRDILVRGSYCYDGTTVVYRDAIPLHMNRGGRPDWIWTPGGTPMPALNCDFGIETDTEPPDPTQQSSEQATYCTLGMLLRYLNAFYGPDADTQEQLVQSAIETALEFNTALDRLPNTFPFQFDWPRTFGQEIDQFVIGNFNNAVGQNNTTTGGARKGRDIRLDRKSVV